MAEKQLPFIDIAVHPGVRDRFAAGQAVILFDIAMNRVLWSNGEAAELFGNGLIYDLIEDGPDRADVAFRQLAASAEQLTVTGARRSLVIRMASGFSRIAVQAELERIDLGSGLEAILLAAPPARKVTGRQALAGRMLSGFDDPDTHMAVLDGDGTVLAASAGFDRTGLTPDLIAPLVASVRRSPDRLVKRPILTGLGYLPAALGMLSDDPETHLLFCVETSLGRMDPPEPVTLAAIETPAETAPDPTFEPETATILPLAETGLDVVTDTILDEARDEAVQDETIELQAEQDDLADLPDRAVVVAETEPGLPDDNVTEEAVTESGDTITLVQPAEDDDDMAEPLWEPEVPGAIDEQLEALSQDTAALAEDADPIEPDASLAEAASLPEETEAPAEPEAVIAAEEPAPALEDIRPAFRFNGAGRPVRFVWKIDTNGVFAEISEEFAATVGPHAAAVSGLAFNDLAALFNLDPDGKVGELLSRRDTWSGRTIHWPVEGTALSVPIDLAALPTYSRAREFDGFRGFGIIRVGDAKPDPLAMGLTLAQTSPAMLTGLETAPDDDDVEETMLAPGTLDTMSAPETAEDTITLADTGLAIDDTPLADNTESADDIELTVDEQFADLDNPDAPREDDSDFRGERPALKFAMTPGRRLSDKIIQLEERRARRNEGLTTGEQAAFREIARQLEPFGKRPNETLFKDKADQTEPGQDQDNGPIDNDLSPVTSEDQTDIVPADAVDTPDVMSEAETPISDAPADPVETEILGDDPVDVEPLFEETTSELATETIETEAEAETEDQADDETDDETLADVPALPVLPRRTSGDSLSAGLVDQLPVAILVHAGDRLIHANPEFFRLTGYADLESLDAAGGLDGLITRLEGEDSASQGAVFLVREDNEVVPVTARLQSVRFDNQTALLLALNPVSHPAAQTAPVTAPVVAPEASDAEDAQALRVEVEELRAILETATDGVVLVTAEGEIRSLNRSASALFNYDREETAGKPFAMLFAHESQKAVMDYLGGLSGHGVASVLNDGREVIGREATGGFIPLFMTMGKLSSGGYCAVIRDITQWKRSEEELRNAKRAAETANAHKSEFLARVSHEIRTPLNAIIGFSDMMSSERFGPIGHQRYVEYSNDIGRSGRHVLDIVNDLLDISKIEAGEMELDFSAVTINECISEAVSIIQPQANSQRVIIRTSLSQSVPQIVADLRSIKQIALNILANAIRYTPSGGQVVVSTAYEQNGSVVLRIRDTGIGMSRSELEQAMKPFRQVTTGSRKRGDGTGLGLPLTKAMVEANRAIFSISSQPNEGTLVEITFPSQRVLAD